MALSISLKKRSTDARVFGDDRLGVVRAIMRYVSDGGADIVHHLDRNDGVFVLGVPVLFGRRLGVGDQPLHRRISADFAAAGEQRVDYRLQVGGDPILVDQQRLGGAADAGPPHLGVDRDIDRHHQLGDVLSI